MNDEKRTYRSTKQRFIKVFHGQCTEKVKNIHNKVIRCTNEGLDKRHGVCEECFNWKLRRKGVYPHKNNDLNFTEVYLIL